MNRHTADGEPSTSVSLLERACRGEVEGWHKLAQIYGPIVYGWVRRSGFQPADAADVMQETFTAVSRALPQFDAQRSGATFRGWLWTITRNKLRDHLRGHTERAAGGTAAQLQLQQLAGDVVAAIPEDPPTDIGSDQASVRRRTIEILRAQFDPRSWQMFWETTVCERNPADVAADLGVSRWAVYKARARVLHRLQAELDGLQ